MSARKCTRCGEPSEIPICHYCDEELAIPSTKTMGNDIDGCGPLLCVLAVMSGVCVVIAAVCAALTLFK